VAGREFLELARAHDTPLQQCESIALGPGGEGFVREMP
jgi:hypothetical protein